jgi:hypothetical protein
MFVVDYDHHDGCVQQFCGCLPAGVRGRAHVVGQGAPPSHHFLCEALGDRAGAACLLSRRSDVCFCKLAEASGQEVVVIEYLGGYHVEYLAAGQ